MKIKKILIFSLTILIASLSFLVIPSAKSQVQPYYDGEAIAYNNQVIFGTTNTGKFELFKLDGNKIIRTSIILSPDNDNNRFFDLILMPEGSGLYAYLVNGKYLYKYNVSDLFNFSLVAKVKDNNYDYFYGLGRSGNNFFTVGSNGIKVWNSNLQVIDAYKNMDTKHPNSIAFSDNGNYIFNTNKGSLKVTDSFYRDSILSLPLRWSEDHSWQPFIDEDSGLVYVADDYSLKKININGNYTEFKHTSNLGYDVNGVEGKDHIYFSDGIGVVKSRISDLKPLDWVYTNKINSGRGWAMGLRAVENNGHEYVVVFNGSSIIVLNENLDLLDSYEARECEIPDVQPLYLSLDKSRATANSQVSVRGGGFGPNEYITIELAGEKFNSVTDKYGEFRRIINVPEVSHPKMYDIKATGQVSKLTYSINFFIE
jgi:hypothetical protein